MRDRKSGDRRFHALCSERDQPSDAEPLVIEERGEGEENRNFGGNEAGRNTSRLSLRSAGSWIRCAANSCCTATNRGVPALWHPQLRQRSHMALAPSVAIHQ
jgi:hypothetical protein